MTSAIAVENGNDQMWLFRTGDLSEILLRLTVSIPIARSEGMHHVQIEQEACLYYDMFRQVIDLYMFVL